MFGVPLPAATQGDLSLVGLEASPKLVPQIQVTVGQEGDRGGGVIGTVSNEKFAASDFLPPEKAG